MSELLTSDEISKLEMQIKYLQKKYEEANRMDYIFRQKKVILSRIRKLNDNLISLNRYFTGKKGQI